MSLGASISSSRLMAALTPWLGLWAGLATLNLVGLGLGVAISAVCGTEIEHSFFIAAV